jgi:membrane protease YdiL (CAAX protease family)
MFNEMVENPLLFALLIGPGLLIGAGIGEELTRTFLLTRFWNLTDNKGIRWLVVLLSAVIFGAAHIYQGMAGVLSTGISGFILASYYLLFGRFSVLIIAHYLHDAFQFAFVYFMAKL